MTTGLEHGLSARLNTSRLRLRTVEEWLSKDENKGRWKLPAKADTPLTTTYRAELDVTPELEPSDASYYQSLIGVLRWIVELGRVDVCLEVSMMSSHLAMPRQGHLEQVLHVFSYLKKYHNTELVYDPSDPAIDFAKYEERDWASSEFGHIPGRRGDTTKCPRAPWSWSVHPGHGRCVTMRLTLSPGAQGPGILVFVNCALVHWISKKQTTVESSSFGSEFVAMKQCCEYLRGLCDTSSV